LEVKQQASSTEVPGIRAWSRRNTTCATKLFRFIDDCGENGAAPDGGRDNLTLGEPKRWRHGLLESSLPWPMDSPAG
jgi:hypothetical protein